MINLQDLARIIEMIKVEIMEILDKIEEDFKGIFNI